MPTVRLRLTADEDVAAELINLVSSLEGIERAEEIADLMPHMDDDDSSSAGSVEDIGPGFHSIDVETSNETTARRVRDLAEAFARDRGVALEFDDEDA